MDRSQDARLNVDTAHCMLGKVEWAGRLDVNVRDAANEREDKLAGRHQPRVWQATNENVSARVDSSQLAGRFALKQIFTVDLQTSRPTRPACNELMWLAVVYLVAARDVRRSTAQVIAEDGISILDGDGDVVLGATRDGRCLTVPEQQSVAEHGRHRQLDNLLGVLAAVRQQLGRQLDVAALAHKLRRRVNCHADVARRPSEAECTVALE